MPLLFNLRHHSCERTHNTHVYEDSVLDHVFMLFGLFGANKPAAQCIGPMEHCPPRQTPGSFDLESVKKQIEDRSRTEN